ncbi:hypothetical protein GF314_16205 [bacterium]|nr:hypothetical protein [bacterium]
MNSTLATRRTVLIAALALLVASAASAQFIQFPRIGVSAAPDRYEPSIDVHGDEIFEMYIVALPPDGEPLLQHDYGTFHWWLLEACCGGAAELIDQEFNPELEHEGSVYAGVITSSEECMDGEAVLLCTLRLQMVVDEPGQYFVMGGPMALSQTCDGEDVVMTDLVTSVNYINDATPVEQTSLTEVKALFE